MHVFSLTIDMTTGISGDMLLKSKLRIFDLFISMFSVFAPVIISQKS